jgi:hypothetical protein
MQSRQSAGIACIMRMASLSGTLASVAADDTLLIALFMT